MKKQKKNQSMDKTLAEKVVDALETLKEAGIEAGFGWKPSEMVFHDHALAVFRFKDGSHVLRFTETIEGDNDDDCEEIVRYEACKELDLDKLGLEIGELRRKRFMDDVKGV
jgi:hypothetical protein